MTKPSNRRATNRKMTKFSTLIKSLAARATHIKYASAESSYTVWPIKYNKVVVVFDDGAIVWVVATGIRAKAASFFIDHQPIVFFCVHSFNPKINLCNSVLKNEMAKKVSVARHFHAMRRRSLLESKHLCWFGRQFVVSSRGIWTTVNLLQLIYSKFIEKICGNSVLKNLWEIFSTLLWQKNEINKRMEKKIKRDT